MGHGPMPIKLTDEETERLEASYTPRVDHMVKIMPQRG